MRGKVCAIFCLKYAVGITPACAGKSCLCHKINSFCGDHPRMCGEKGHIRPCPCPAQGSPPHVRGKADTRAFASAFPRITPACAGKRLQRGRKTPMAEGSPPHVRGKVRYSSPIPFDMRITPACAGKSMGESGTADAARDHPRMCGEKFSTCSSA